MADENTVDEGQETVTPAADPVPVNPMLVMLKVDLGISTTAYDERLGQYLTSAKAEIVREGVTFPETLTVDDMQLIVGYAAWMWRRRDGELGKYGSGQSMPRMVRYLLNNRLMSQKMGGDANG